MNTRHKTGWLALGLAMTWAFASTAEANSDSLTVTITPAASYIVDIDTGPSAGAWLDLGSVNLGASTWTVRPATVAVQSTYAATELSLEGLMAAGGWTFDSDTSTDENNALKAW